MKKIQTIMVEKKDNFKIESKHLLEDLKTSLRLEKLNDLRIINRYDIIGLDSASLKKVANYILSDPVVDNVYFDKYDSDDSDFSLSIEYLPGQYDQRADSTEQCIKILIKNVNCQVKTSKIYLFYGIFSEEEKRKIEEYLINPVDSCKSRKLNTELKKFEENYFEKKDVESIEGFCSFTMEELEEFHNENNMAMSLEDLKFCQKYFDNEGRNPTSTEIKVIDTYWSDHCRHTTFSTELYDIDFSNGEFRREIKAAFDDFKNDHMKYNKNKPVTLMNIATLRAKIEKKNGNLNDLVESDEINACTIEIAVDENGKNVPYNLLFKNETHNHPTEIEPFGGAATCLGGAIRDPLSGRAYVYQSMRITGSADPRTKIEETLLGKLPQRKITREAAKGFSSYGNQIGLATGLVHEFYNKGFMAKRMECGAVIGAVPSANVKREKPENGDLILLIGGETGRDGCGGATGSSKSHNSKSLEKCGAEVQKGNPLTERKLQRLFKNPQITKRIKKCNDFGAGGVSVAIGEIAESLEIDLDSIRKKYRGLNGTELAISESQERMAVLIDKRDLEFFENVCKEENILCDVVAKVTEDERLIMKLNNKKIVDIKRSFLNTNGVSQKQKVKVASPEKKNCPIKNNTLEELLKDLENDLQKLSQCSQYGLTERFDSSIGRASVLVPYGGKYQKTPSQVMASKIPTEKDTTTTSIMGFGYDPEISSWSPFHGAIFSVIESCSKIVVTGAKLDQIRFSFQEYFERLENSPEKWGKPFSALLGAYKIQKELNYPAIGGKDSMSGSFNELNVPPTLISFAVGISNANKIVSNELKRENNYLVISPLILDENLIPDIKSLKETYKTINNLIEEDKIYSSGVTDATGIFTHLAKRSFGNKIGFEIYKDIKKFDFTPFSIVIEVDETTAENLEKNNNFYILGKTNSREVIKYGDEKYDISSLINKWEESLEEIFPIYEKIEEKEYSYKNYKDNGRKKCNFVLKKGPRVFIPVFPGTNCEYDTKKAFEDAGANCSIKVFRNSRKNDIEESTKIFADEISNSQILMIPGGFSAGDEPDGSGKFISAVFRNTLIKESILTLLNKNDGLILGICNGFQVLLRLGLLPFGKYIDPDESFPTLTYNSIGRHISSVVKTKVISTKSPWINENELGKVYKVPISHTEGRFFCSENMLKDLENNGQIATCYCGSNGEVSSKMPDNPNGSVGSIEGITSPDGKIMGKMGHNERVSDGLYKNIPDVLKHNIFKNGVDYFQL